jgi:hypothetical protein
MRLHALLQFVQPSWLSNPEQLLHLCLQHTQLAQHLPLELRHNHLIPNHHYESGTFKNTALENREYSAGELASYIRT